MPADGSFKGREAMRILFGVLALALTLGACGPVEREARFSGSRAYDHAGEQLEMGPRHPGSRGHGEVQAWIHQGLADRGWHVERQEFTYQGLELANLIGRREGRGDRLYLVGAHYDTRPVADEEPSSHAGPVPGANDGASGVAVLMELARVLPAEGLSCDIWLAFFDAEDSGRLDGWDWIVGSSYFVAHMRRMPEAAVIVDMVGDRDLQLHRERNSDPALTEEIWSLGRSLGFEPFRDSSKYSIVDDHTPFLRRGIPAVDIIDFDYPYWHTREDTMDKLSPQSLEAVGRTVEVWLEGECGGGLES